MPGREAAIGVVIIVRHHSKGSGDGASSDQATADSGICEGKGRGE